VNGYLDIGYIAVGIVVALLFGRADAGILGHGAGIAFQGAFLLIFDFYFATVVSQAVSGLRGDKNPTLRKHKGVANDDNET
jgi:hypothetical protein